MRITNKLTKSLLAVCTGSVLALAQAPAPTGANPASSGTQSAPHAAGAQHGNHKADHGLSSHTGAGLMVGTPDQQFLIKAAQGGMMEIEAARLAQEKATSSEIKDFARKLEQDHTKASEQLKQLAAQKNVELPSDMGPHRAMLDKVKAASGDQFDKQWLKMQVQHHKKDVNEFQKETTRAMDSDVRNFAAATLPTLQGHLQQVQELENSSRGRKSDTAKSTSDAGRTDSTKKDMPSSTTGSESPSAAPSPTK